MDFCAVIENYLAAVYPFLTEKNELLIKQYNKLVSVLDCIESGVDVNFEYENQCKLLHCVAGHLMLDSSLIQYLLEIGAEVDAQNYDGDTPLQTLFKCSSESEDEEILKSAEMLLAHGADINRKNKDGITVLHWIALNGSVNLADFAMRNGADVYAKDNLDDTPLTFAFVSKKFELVKFFIIHGADVNAISRDESTRTLLHMACEDNDVKFIEVLLKNGADVNAVCPDGDTPLITAIKCIVDAVETIKLLLNYGADVNMMSRSGNHVLSNALSLKLDDRSICILKHIAELQAADQFIHPKIISVISDNIDLVDYFTKCNSELSLMKDTEFPESWVSLYHLFKCDILEIAKLVGNEELSKHFDNIDVKEYPIFYSKIKSKILQGTKRRKLLDRAAWNLFDIFGVLSPDHYVYNYIIYQMNDDDLIKLNQ